MSLSEISPAFTTNVLDEIVRAKGGFKHQSWRFVSFKGDSFLSETFKVEIDGLKSEKSGDLFKIHTVIKSLPKNIGRTVTFRCGDFFRNEINFYQKVLPECLKFQDQVKPAIRFEDIPECLAAFHDNVNDYVVLSDLSIDGFGAANRQVGMDFNHCKFALETLGKLHGISLAYRNQRPEEFEKLLGFLEVTI